MFKINEAPWDRGLRLAAGASLSILALAGVVEGAVAWLALTVAVVLLATALAGWCRLYAALRVSTKKEARPGSSS